MCANFIKKINIIGLRELRKYVSNHCIIFHSELHS